MAAINLDKRSASTAHDLGFTWLGLIVEAAGRNPSAELRGGREELRPSAALRYVRGVGSGGFMDQTVLELSK